MGMLAGQAVIAAALARMTSGVPAVAPSVTVLALVAGVLGGLILLTSERSIERSARWEWLVGLVVALVVGGGAGHIMLLREGFPYSQDGGTHLWGLHAMFRAMGDGWWPPRLVPDLGPGIPLGVHYGPLAYWPALMLMKTGMPVYDAFKASLVLSLVGSAWTMYRAARRMTGERGAAIVSSVAFVFAPYHLLDTHYRGALGESIALVALPVFLEAFSACLSGRQGGADRRLTLATMWMALSHPVTLFGVAVPAVVGALVWWAHGGRAPSVRVAVPMALGVALSAFWVVPAVMELARTMVPALFGGRHPDFAEHGLSIGEWISRRAWYGRLPSLPLSDAVPGGPGEMPFYVGLVLLLNALALVFVQKRTPSARVSLPEERVLLSMLLASLAASLFPVARALAAWPGFPAVRYPFRFLGPASACAALAVGLLAARVNRAMAAGRRPGTGVSDADVESADTEPGHAGPASTVAAGSCVRRERAVMKNPAGLPALVLLGMLILDAAPYTGAADWVPAYRGAPHFFRDPEKRADAPLFMDGAQARYFEIPAGRRTRVDGLEFPPSSPDIPLAQARGTFAEYYTPRIHKWLTDSRIRKQADRDLGVLYAFAPPFPAPLEIAGARSWAAIVTDAGVVPVEGASRGERGDRFSLSLPPGHPAGRVRVLEQALPGWEYSVDGVSWREVPADEQGFMVVPVDADVTSIAYRLPYWTPARTTGWIVSLAALAGLCGAFFWRRRMRGDGESGAMSVRVREGGGGSRWVMGAASLVSRWRGLDPLTRDRLLLGIVSALLLGFRLGRGSLENGTDAIYGIAIRDLVTRWEWLKPLVHGTPYVMKPPLFFWTAAILVHFMGLTELALRLPSALSAWVGVMATFEIGRRLGSRRLAWVAAFLLLSCTTYFEYARRVFMDPMLAAFTAAGVAAFFYGFERPRLLWAGSIFTGLALATKSYAGGFGAAAVGAYILLFRRDLLRARALWGGAIAGLLIPLPWVCAQLLFNKETFIHQNVEILRLQSEAQFSWHPTRPAFYVVEMLEKDPLFTVLALAGILLIVLRAGNVDKRWWIPILWLIPGVALYWNLNQQRMYYMLPLLPAAALLAACTVDLYWPRRVSPVLLGGLLALMVLFKGAPFVAAEGMTVDPAPGIRAMAKVAGEVMPEGSTLYVWNDFFAAPELYSGHPAVQLSPSKSLVEELGRILVVGELGIARYIRPPDALWSMVEAARSDHSPFFLLISDGQLEKLAPGFHDAWIVASGRGWSLLSLQATGRRGERAVTTVHSPLKAYLAAVDFLAKRGEMTRAARVLMAMAKVYPAEEGRARRLARDLLEARAPARKH